MRHPWYFVLPEERGQPSGGNIYNERIIGGLARWGQPVEIIAVDYYWQAVRQDHPGTYWVDTLVLEQLSDILSLRPTEPRSLLIIHHLESLAPPPGQFVEVLQAKEKPFLEWFNGFLATSSFTQDYLREQGLSQPVIVAEPGVDIVQDQEITSQRKTEKIHALIVANLVERKGILPWLQSLAQRLQPTDQFRLTVVGRSDIEPDYARQCWQLIQEHPLLSNCVTVVGSQSPEQMPAYYQRANLFVSAARMETYGMALQEARIHRLPILALRGGNSTQHILAGQNGYVFDDLSTLRNFFLDLVREPAKFTTLYQQAQQCPPTYVSWEQTAQSLIQQFDQFFNYAP